MVAFVHSTCWGLATTEIWLHDSQVSQIFQYFLALL